MRLLRIILVLTLLAGMPGLALCAQAPEAGVQAAAEHEEHGLPQKADVVGHVLGLPITNSMVVTWMVALGLIVFAQVATRNMKEVPDGAQNFWEWMVESLHDFLEGIIGHHLVKKTFWFFATVFIFILFSQLGGTYPGLRHDRLGTRTRTRFRG